MNEELRVFQRVKASGEMRKQMQTKVRDMIRDEEPAKDIVNALLEDVRKNSLSEHEVVVLVRSLGPSLVFPPDFSENC